MRLKKFKYIFSLFILLGLFTNVLFSQNGVSYTQCWEYRDFVASNVNGAGSACLHISNNTLTFTFSAGFDPTALKIGAIKQIVTNPVLPDMYLGGWGPMYSFVIKDGWLTTVLGYGGSLTSINANCTVDLSAYFLGSPTDSENYIATRDFLKPGITVGTVLAPSDARSTVQYFDGLGRLKQTVNVQNSPSKMDIITPVTYDNVGRRAINYLPFPQANGSSGSYVADDVTKQTAYYTSVFATDGTKPFAVTGFESSPLNRVFTQGAPGVDWQPDKHSIQYNYCGNAPYEVLSFEVVNGYVSNSGGVLWGINGKYYYNEYDLYKTVIKDEDWSANQSISLLLHTTEEFINRLGQVILKRSYVDIGLPFVKAVDTYYVYDNYGLLRFVLPPEAADIIIQSKVVLRTNEVAENITTPVTKYAYENKSYILAGGSVTLGNGFVFTATAGKSFSIINGGKLSQTGLDNLIYQYKYDERKRMIAKQIPSADEVYMVYDKCDRLVLTQDGKMRTENSKQWNFIKYDPLNRPAITGAVIFPDYRNQAEMQCFVKSATSTRSISVARDNSITPTGYTDVSFPISTDGVLSYLTATYYDTYSFPGSRTWNSANSITGFVGNYFTRTVGLVTGSRELVLGSTTYLTTTNYYDDHYRVIETLKDVYDNGPNISHEISSNKYDFVGKVIQSRQMQAFANSGNYINGATVINKYFRYDHAGRLLATDMQVQDDATGKVSISELAYNEIGQLVDKKLHKTAAGTFNQSVDYKYNIRGWLTSINDPFAAAQTGDPSSDLFAEQLLYNTKVGILNNTSLYNGNISSQIWRNGIGGSVPAYNYSYDGVNRITSSDFKYYSGSGYADAIKYEERGITYDLNGNIKTLTRTDDLGGTTGVNGAAYSYNYNGNQLKDINGGAAYGYDKNGNMTADGRTGNAFAYNMLNLPQKVSKGADNINYTYSATGQKLLKNYNGISNQYYAGNMVYSNSKALDYIIFEEGVIRKTSTGFSYEYNLKDHLGNTRAVFRPRVGDAPELAQVTDYYPFGQQFYVPSATSSTTNKYLYNGKELQDDKLAGSSLNMLDYGARFYDAQIGRWGAIDPKAEKKPWISPYVYCSGNAVNRIDPDGRDDTYYNSQGAQTKVVERAWLFELFAGNRNYISDDKGKNFKLTNQALDVVKSGKFNGFESNWETSNSKTGFNSLINNATSPKGKENAFSYVFRESKDGGNLDQKKNLDPYKIYGASSSAMNKNEAGNYVWGAALAKFGFSTSDALNLANGGTLYLETISRPNREGLGWGINDIGYRLSRVRFDEPDELKAIEAGSIKIFGFQIVY